MSHSIKRTLKKLYCCTATKVTLPQNTHNHVEFALFYKKKLLKKCMESLCNNKIVKVAHNKTVCCLHPPKRQIIVLLLLIIIAVVFLVVRQL